MSRINTNVQSLLAQRILGLQNKSLTTSLERLSTGLAINRGADNPAGLIASEALRSEKASLTAAIGNAERADQVVNIAEGGLQEINALLLEVQGLVTESANTAGLSTDELEANQLQIDSIIQTVDRIAAATSFQGTKLLNGSFDFSITNQASTVADVQINGAKLNFGETRAVQVVVTASAQRGSLFLSANNASLVLNDLGTNFTFEVAGKKGSREFSFASGTALTAVRDSINSFKDVTGVSAVVSGTGIRLKSDEFGSLEFVSVKIIEDAGINAGGGGAAAGILTTSATDEDVAVAGSNTLYSAAEGSSSIKDSGQDVASIINGIVATAKGKIASVSTDFLDLELELTTAGATALATIAAVTIQSGGAKFLLGPSVDITNQVRLGIGNVAARELGKLGTGFLDDLATGKSNSVVDGNLEDAQTIVDSAIAQVSKLRGRLGAFQKNTIGATIRSLGVALENTSAAESSIRDTDFAAETARLTRAQILVNAATNVLSIANSQPQSVLSLLG